LSTLGLLESRHQPKNGRLPASTRAQQGEEFSPPYLQGKIRKRRMFPVALADIPKLDNARR